MPLLITPAVPLITPHGLTCPVLYAIIDECGFNRKERSGSFTLGYYLHEAASLPGSGVFELPVDLQRGFTFSISPEQADALESPQAVMEAYAHYELLQQLPEGSTIETVA